MITSLTLALLMSPAVAATTEPAVLRQALVAETIFHNGPVITIDDADPTAEAVAVRDGKIIAVGTSGEVMKMKGGSTKMIDLKGQALLPGFVDAHGHVTVGGFQALTANLLSPPDGKVVDIASLQKSLKDWVGANAEPVKKFGLIVGFGYDLTTLKELRHPTREDLDAVSKDLPVIIIHQSGHIGVLNSKALELVGMNAQTKDPAGGVIRRQAGGSEPDGVVEETAFFGSVAKLLGKVADSGLEAFVEAGAKVWAKYGYTTAQEGRSNPLVDASLRAVAKANKLPIDVASYTDVLVDKEYALKSFQSDYVNRFRVAGLKLTIDGSAQGFTAWRDRPYYNSVGTYPPGYLGYPAVTNQQVIEAIDWAYKNNLQILTHANGEAANDLLIAALTAAQAKYPGGDRRSVMIHGQYMREDQMESYRKLNVIPSLFTMHTFYWGDWHRDHTVGPVNADNICPTGWANQRGMRFTAHHDAPVALPDSMRVLDSTVTRRSRSGDIMGPHQRVSVLDALKAMTIWPAYQHFEEARKGSIEVGKLADLIILSKNPLAVPIDDLDQLKVVETFKEGKSIFQLGNQPTARAGDTRFEAVFSQTLHSLSEGKETRADHHAGEEAPCVCGFANWLGDIVQQERDRK